MTIIEEARFGTEGQVYGQVYEAPIHQSRGCQRQAWKYEELPFFPQALRRFWRLYSTPFSNRDWVFLSPQEEAEERLRFIQRPVVVMVNKSIADYAAIGGAWIDQVLPGADGKCASFHIKVQRESRRFAYPLLHFFIQTLEHRYEQLSVEWGRRGEQDNPAKFFMNNGFQVSGGKEGGRAFLNLRERGLVNRIPIISELDQ